MTAHALVFDQLDGDRSIPPLTVTGDTPADLAQAVHHHARGRLGARRVDVEFDPDCLAGTILRHGTLVGQFTLTALPSPEPTEEHTSSAVGHLRHGWMLADVDRIAWGVAASDRWHRGTPVQERYDHARYGIVVHLLDADQPPAEYDLYRAGLAEINRAIHAELRFRCLDDANDFGFVPRAAAYWHRPVSHPVEERVVERLALHQVWPLATKAQRAALAALAACEDYQGAADALGLKPAALYERIGSARERIAAAWFEHETPPPRKHKDRRVFSRSGLDRFGRERITVSQLEEVRTRRAKGELLRDIAPDYDITRQALGALLRGVRQPAPDPAGGAA